MRGSLALVLGTLAGCYNPALQDCAVTCANNACPSGFQCVAGLCRSSTGACPGGGSADGPDISGFAFRKKITINVIPGGPVPNFPLSIRRTTDPDLANFAQSDGVDILFTAVDGMALSSELERFDKSTGELVAWVNVPMLGVTNELYMYFGSETASRPAPTGVWDPSYIGVWHLSDPPGSSVADSTANANAAQKTIPTGPSPTLAGKLAGAHVFAGTANESLSIGSSAAVSPAELTFETWINYAIDNSNTFRSLFATSNAVPQNPSLLYPNDGVQAALPRESLFVSLGQQGYFSPGGSFKQNVWNHVVLTTAGTLATTSLYINGAKQTLSSSGQLFPAGSAVTFGGLNATSLSVSGSMDEMRYSKTIRSTDYAIASYVSQSDGTFVTFGAVETVR